VDFKNTVIILTSNIGSQQLLQGTPEGRESALEAARRHFPPEFLNRLSDICIFDKLGQSALRKVVQKSFKTVASRLEAQGVHAILSERGADAILDASFDPQYGARPVERYLEKSVVTKLSKMMLADELPSGSEVEITADNRGNIVFEKKKH